TRESLGAHPGGDLGGLAWLEHLSRAQRGCGRGGEVVRPRRDAFRGRDELDGIEVVELLESLALELDEEVRELRSRFGSVPPHEGRRRPLARRNCLEVGHTRTLDRATDTRSL